MTRKHFQLIADVVKSLPTTHSADNDTYEEYVSKDLLVRRLAHAFKADNERFDREKFLLACWEVKTTAEERDAL